MAHERKHLPLIKTPLTSVTGSFIAMDWSSGALFRLVHISVNIFSRQTGPLSCLLTWPFGLTTLEGKPLLPRWNMLLRWKYVTWAVQYL